MSQEFPQGGRMALHEVYQEIMSRAPEHDFDPSLDRMAMVLDFLGHPEKSFRVIHVTGTNGKGSTSYMAESLCRAYGLRTGLYTSPHIQSVTERISIDGQHVSDEQFVDLYYQVKDFIDMADRRSIESGGPRMSFFEVLTAMAVWAFADAPVDVAIVEVGMGGTWDATNVLDADAAVIGPVDMDHMQWLG
ncbi:MAG: dihydrofolate synthase, partial [Scardovia wiggsiae]|nr:dihydrofolate synthase [Scardovia wiggsiae]